MAQAFPRSRFVGIDTHEESLRAARRHAAEAGMSDRLSFERAGANGYRASGFDLICFFDALHDMGHPDAAARHALGALAPDGTVMLVEPYADDRAENNFNPVGRLYYSASTAICCAHAIAENGPYVLGAQAVQPDSGGARRKVKSGTWRESSAASAPHTFPRSRWRSTEGSRTIRTGSRFSRATSRWRNGWRKRSLTFSSFASTTTRPRSSSITTQPSRSA
jgi:SAM-dependent methyltransferase